MAKANKFGNPKRVYRLNWSTDLKDFNKEITEDISSGGQITTHEPFANPSVGAPRINFKVAEQAAPAD